MNPFTYTIVNAATEAVNAYQGAANPLYVAGATDVLQLLQEHVSAPGTLIDIGRLPFTHIEGGPNGVRIGAMARLAGVAEHDAIIRYYPVLSTALRETASPQVRNMATAGGNLLQKTRCLYFRDAAAPCNKRLPGSGCPAKDGMNRMNAILGTSDLCIAAYPGDMAVALMILDAHIQVQGPDGERSIPIAELYRVPDGDATRDTTLHRGELITHIDLPADRFHGKSAFVKVRDRATFEWALASAAVGLEMDGNTIAKARVAVGGVATAPWPLPAVEKALAGQALSAETAASAASHATQGAQVHSGNAFKLKLLPRVVEQAILTAGGQP